MTKTLLTAAMLAALSAGVGRAETLATAIGVDRVVHPGQPLDGVAMVELALRRPLPAGGGVARTATDLAGKVAARTILPNRPIPMSYLREPFLVEAGKPVRVVYRSGTIRIEMTGQALAAAAAGEAVRIRNAASGAVLSGVVSGVGEVTVARP